MELAGQAVPLLLLGGDDLGQQPMRLLGPLAHPRLELPLPAVPLGHGARELDPHRLEAPRQCPDLVPPADQDRLVQGAGRDAPHRPRQTLERAGHVPRVEPRRDRGHHQGHEAEEQKHAP